MKKTIFSKGIFVESLRRLRVVGFLVLAGLLILQSIPVIIQATDYSYYLSTNRNYTFEPMALNFQTILLSLFIMATFVAPIMVLSLFSVFNKRASSDFYHSLPYTRTCLFVSKMAAVYAWVIGISAICSTLGLIVYTCLPKLFVVSFGGGFDLLLSYIAILLITTGGCALAMAITGTVFSNFCVAGLIIFLPRVIITVLSLYISEKADFLVFNYTAQTFLSPSFNVLFASVGGGTHLTNNLPADIYSLCLGLVYLALALLVFIKRKSETADQPAPGRLWQHIIRILITTAFALIPVIFLVDGSIAPFIVFSLITALIYFAYEIISTKKWKNCLKAAPGLLVVAGLSLVLVLTIILVPKLSAKYTPDADDIDSVKIMRDNYENFDYYGSVGNWYGYEAEKLSIKDKKVLEIVSETLNENMESYEKHGEINYKDNGSYSSYVTNGKYQIVAIKDGPSVRYRKIFFTEEQYTSLLDALNEDERYIEAIRTLPKPAKGSVGLGEYDELSAKDLEKIYDSIAKEMHDLTVEEVYNVANNYSYQPGCFNVWYYTDDFNSMYVDLYIDSDTFPKTFELILDLVSYRNNRSKDELDDLLLDTLFFDGHEIWYANVDASVKLTTEEGEARYYYLDTYYEGDTDAGEWADLDSTKSLAKLYEAVKELKGKATAESYICFSYNCDFDYSGSGNTKESRSYYSSVYLPLPKDFDPEEYGLAPVDYYEDANDLEIDYEYEYLD